MIGPFEAGSFEFETIPLSGEIADDAAMREFDFGESEMAWEAEFSRRLSPHRPGFAPRAPRFTPPRQLKWAPAAGLRRPKRSLVGPPRLPLVKRRSPRRVIVQPYGVTPEPYAVEPPPGSEYVRWAQSALNDALGLQLPVHGVMDAATRSAIRSFQQRQGLPADGVIGPDSERALIVARRGRSPRDGAPRPAAGMAEPGATEPAEPTATSVAPTPAVNGAEGELSRLARPCDCPSCRRGEPCPCHAQREGPVTNIRVIQPEAFEFEPESSFGEFETEVWELENGQPEWPTWPRSRTFNPPAQSVPSGPFTTHSPCQAILDDFTKLTLAVGDLKRQLRQSPPDQRTVSNRSSVVRALSRHIVKRLQELRFKGCTREDLTGFASSVNLMRGPGADGDVGNWPRGSAGVKNPRTAARESLRHLLNWIRRAERNFP